MRYLSVFNNPFSWINRPDFLTSCITSWSTSQWTYA